MSKNDLIVKSNQVVEASYTLTTIEQRLILSAIAQIPKGEAVTDEVIYTVSVTDLQKFGANETTAYRDLKESVSRLFERSIVLRSSDRTSRTRWVQKIDFMDSRGVIGIRFSKDILPFLSNLSTEFTKYLASDLIGVTSAYAIRLYELLAQYRTIGKREISVEDLRWMFELQEKYPLFADLKKRVIDQSLKEINEFSPIKVTCTARKTGRKFTHFVFKIEDKKALKAPKEKASGSNYGGIPPTSTPPKGMSGIGSITNAMVQKNANSLAHRLSKLMQHVKRNADLRSRIQYPNETHEDAYRRLRAELTSDQQFDMYLMKFNIDESDF